MRAIISLALVLIGAQAAQAQIYKCIEGGKIIFTDRPCAGSADQGVYFREQPRTVLDTGVGNTIEPDTSARTYITSLKAKYYIANDKTIRLKKELDDLEKQQNDELERLRIKKNRANNNLAGAVWEQSINEEMNAVISAYKLKMKIAYDELTRAIAERDAIKAQIEQAGGMVYQ